MNFRTLDLNLLRVFDTVMAERNLTRAAEQLAMTQPAVSNALRRLRESVGEALFTRSAFGVRPTARAEALWPTVQSALTQLRDSLDPSIYEPRSQPHTFALAMADATAALILPRLLGQLQAEHALASLRVQPLATRDPSPLLEQGEADLAIGHFPEVAARMSGLGAQAPLLHQSLYQTEYVCVMRRGHPLAEGELSLDAYCAADHLLVSFSGRGQGLIDEALASVQRRRRLVLTVNQFFTAGRVVAQTDLLTVLPDAFLSVTGAQQELVSRALPLPLAALNVHMLWHRRHDRHPAQRWLREQITQAVGAPPRSAKPQSAAEP
ncbi:transcriptional regulator, LysR family [Leptothrix cholodnii SP-6]|uniref:Transcriptional regulator, LysR family n=1 Tax=Leptothrix cholodnii (strain ATCC 51168 / LMG 8142 / SP-6) TaxID=395495 RepID=B1Y8D5_LEPCP|nr:LysR family transcriptional regulator [Leptothrix cholodnii]ACB36201.1 transcriptional regulator, LysR family [Leptothrix cholodnii SP-6]